MNFDCIIGRKVDGVIEWDMAVDFTAENYEAAIKELFENHLESGDKPNYLILTGGDTHEEADKEMQDILYPSDEEKEKFNKWIEDMSKERKCPKCGEVFGEDNDD